MLATGTKQKVVYKSEPQVILPKPVILKDFLCTAYCPCKVCNEEFSNYVCDEKTMQYYWDRGEHIVAVDPKVIPLGTKIIWNDEVYTARDVGRLVKGKHIDILLANHKETIKFGRKLHQDIEVVR